MGPTSIQPHRKDNGTDNDTAASVVDESSPPYQTRKIVSGAGDKSLAIGICNGHNSNYNDQDYSSIARDSKFRHVTGNEDEDGNLCWRVEQEIKERDFDDALTDSLYDLRILQDELQLEIEKFWLIGNGSFFHDDAEASFVDLGFHDSCSSGHPGKQISSSSVELRVVSRLTEKIIFLESRIDELQGVIALKNSRIAELETALTCGEFAKEESTCNNIGFLDENFKEFKSELESLFRQKIDAETKYLTIKKMMQNSKVASALAEKQKAKSGSKVQISNKLEEAGNRIDKESVKLARLRFGIFIQFVMLIVIILYIVVELMPNSKEVFPT